ncbi:MAG: hypothetical protein JW915_15250 [Chitinispirillaceae bacterium]|nr:hypothetical protein [Chitinispirillaceae bacterium]
MDRLIVCMLLLALLSGCASRQSSGIRGDDSVELASSVTYSGGKGESTEDAVIIRGVSKQSEGLIAEYTYISGIHGIKNKNWSLYGQTIMKENGKVYEVIEIKLIDFNNEQRIYYFDVTSFPWKKQ